MTDIHANKPSGNTVRATRRFPIEVRYSDAAHRVWTLYSRHQSRMSADRAFVELCHAEPDRWVQMRNDFDGSGVLRSRWVAALGPAVDVEDEIDAMSNDGRLGAVAKRLAIEAGADWPSLDGEAQDNWHQRAIDHVRGIRVG